MGAHLISAWVVALIRCFHTVSVTGIYKVLKWINAIVPLNIKYFRTDCAPPPQPLRRECTYSYTLENTLIAQQLKW